MNKEEFDELKVGDKVRSCGNAVYVITSRASKDVCIAVRSTTVSNYEIWEKVE